jgi:hypothetical protein
MWKKQGKVLSLSGGKITGIFSMEQVLLKEILHEVS